MDHYLDISDKNEYQSVFEQIQEEIIKYSNSLKKYMDLSEENPYYEFFTQVQDEIVKYSKSFINKLESYTGF